MEAWILLFIEFIPWKEWMSGGPNSEWKAADYGISHYSASLDLVKVTCVLLRRFKSSHHFFQAYFFCGSQDLNIVTRMYCYESEDSMVLSQMQWKAKLYNSL